MSIGRMDVHQIVNTLMAVVNYNDANVANGNVFGTLPKYATIIGIQVNIDTAFNAGTTNGLTLGTAACPPYHLAIVIGGMSAEQTLKTVKLASARYLDALPTSGGAPRSRSWSCRARPGVTRRTRSGSPRTT